MKNPFAVRSAMKFACLFAFMSAALAACGETWVLNASNPYATLAWKDMQYWQSVEGGTNGVAGAEPSGADMFLVTAIIYFELEIPQASAPNILLHSVDIPSRLVTPAQARLR